MNDLDLDTLHDYHRFLEYRFGKLEKKQLNEHDPRRGRQMQKYLDQAEAVLDLIDRLEAGDA